jgi:hypothetical protein
MISDFEWPTAVEPGDEKLIADVREHGCHLMSVFGTESTQPFTYSIGLFLNYEHPEIIVFGLPGNKAGPIINGVRDLVQAGTRFDAGSTSDEILQRHSVTFLEVEDEQYGDHLGFALWFYRSLLPETFPCLQLVWPDKKGLFPWQRDFDGSLKDLQPLLGGLA